MKKTLFVALAALSLGIAGPSLAAGDKARGKQLSATCAACHGGDGNSFNPEWPKLAGQHASYIVKQLADFKEGRRKNATMAPMAAPLSAQDREDLAAYFASQATKPGTADEKLVERGRLIYMGGVPADGVPACAACHGPDGAGNPAAKFPKLASQHAKYVEIQLKDFRSGKRANDAGRMMRNAVAKMSDADIKAVAQYIQGLKP
ncbi:MAG TPA: cytochrome c4 [Chromatiales bacterium]|nr:cytochrome c4 [Chromatiales bacterium]